MKRKLLASVIICLLISIHRDLYSQTFTSSNLPIVVINTSGQTINPYQKYYVSMGIIDHGPGVRNNLSDPFNNFSGPVELQLHGQSTLYLPKSSYDISAVNAAHHAISVSLMGLPAGKDWVFKALYQDKSFLRDDLAFKIGREMGHYSSASVFCEIVVDGDYKGVYELEEKIKRDNARVNISKLTPIDTVGDALTGGYIIRLDKFLAGDAGWYSQYMSSLNHDSANYFLYHYPKADSMPLVQKNYIHNFFDTFENILANPDPAVTYDPVNGYRKYFVMPSVIDNFIVNEISKNTDGYRSSTYFYKDKDSKGGQLHFGPLWDYNIAWDNCNFNGGDNPAGWQFQVFATQNFVPFWWWRIFSDTWFKDHLTCRYQELRSNVLSLSHLDSYIDSMASYLDEAQVRNFQRWPILGQYVWPNPSPYPATYAGEIAVLKNWLQQRFAWMDSNMPGTCYVGIDEQALADNAMNVYPNPFTNNITLSYRLQEGGKLKIELLNVVGDKIQLITDAERSSGDYKNEIVTEGLTQGIYLVKMTFNNHVSYKKIVKM